MSLEHSPVRQRRQAQPKTRPPASRSAFTINEFCAEYRLSRSMLYRLWRDGIGPRFIEIGIKKIITVEAAADWAVEGERRASGEDE
jgi:hypothetical protein